jgi:hypothetical protein
MSSPPAESTVAGISLPPIKEALEYVYGGLKRINLPPSLPEHPVVLQGCLPLLMEEVSAEVLSEQLGEKKYEQLRALYRESSLLNLWYAMELKQVLEALTAAAIRVMVLKGADLAETVYPRPELRHFGDIDLMVLPKDLAATLALLEKAGYRYHQEYRFEAISKDRAGFVYIKEAIPGYIVFEIHTSPHSNEMEISFESARLWERARPISIAEIEVEGMGLEDLLLYLCWHYRSHVFSRLIWLYDIALFLQRYGDQLDWVLLERLAEGLGLKATVYYSLWLCQRMFHVVLPANARVDRLLPSRFVQWLIRRSVGEDLLFVLRRSAARKRKLLQRLMVDTARSLGLIALRALFPSPSHLGRLYMEHSCLPVQFYWLYYPIHPFFVLWEGMRSLRRVLSGS